MFFFETLLLVAALSTDAFAASFAYGSDRIKIPIISICLISGICGFILMIALVCGEIVQTFLPFNTVWLSFWILFILGTGKLLNCFLKRKIQKWKESRKQISFSCFHLTFLLDVYANPKEADSDLSKTLSPLEAIPLSIALSFDGLAAGFGMAFGDPSIWSLVVLSVVFNFLAIFFGDFLGKKAAEHTNLDLSWLGGVILILLAGLKWL